MARALELLAASVGVISARQWTPSAIDITSSTLQGDGTVVYYAHAVDKAIARAVVQVFKGCISDVLVYRQADRRRGIAK